MYPCRNWKNEYTVPAMKKEAHPTMYMDAKTTCVGCKSVFSIPSTVADQQVELCRLCHPIYTGKAQKDLKGGRIDRFRKRLSAVQK